MPTDPPPPPTTPELLQHIEALRAELERLKTAAAGAEGLVAKELRAEFVETRKELRELQEKVGRQATPRPERGFLDLF